MSGLDAFAAGWFAAGLLTWTSGANLGAMQTMASHLVGETGVVLVLEEAALQPVAAGRRLHCAGGLRQELFHL